MSGYEQVFANFTISIPAVGGDGYSEIGIRLFYLLLSRYIIGALAPTMRLCAQRPNDTHLHRHFRAPPDDKG